MGLSAKQEKESMFQQIKKEVIEMIKMRSTSLESKVCIWTRILWSMVASFCSDMLVWIGSKMKFKILIDQLNNDGLIVSFLY